MGGIEDGLWVGEELERKLAAVGDRLRRIYRDAAEAGTTPAAAAETLAAERIAPGRDTAAA